MLACSLYHGGLMPSLLIGHIRTVSNELRAFATVVTGSPSNSIFLSCLFLSSIQTPLLRNGWTRLAGPNILSTALR